MLCVPTWHVIQSWFCSNQLWISKLPSYTVMQLNFKIRQCSLFSITRKHFHISVRKTMCYNDNQRDSWILTKHDQNPSSNKKRTRIQLSKKCVSLILMSTWYLQKTINLELFDTKFYSKYLLNFITRLKIL